jgi:hypothetical protein
VNFSYQLSAISYQLSAISRQPSVSFSTLVGCLEKISGDPGAGGVYKLLNSKPPVNKLSADQESYVWLKKPKA